MAAVWIRGASAPMATVHLRPPEQVEDVEHVLGALWRPDIAGHDGDALHDHLRRTTQEHNEGRAVVAEESGIGVEDNEVAGSALRGR